LERQSWMEKEPFHPPIPLLSPSRVFSTHFQTHSSPALLLSLPYSLLIPFGTHGSPCK
jgi:hypothetical protein